jgi:hypothetical protein
MNKYQFYISFNDKLNTASSKAIDDCTQLLEQQGYKNYNLVNNGNRGGYLWSIFVQVLKLIYSIEAGSIVAIQYPLLSGNRVFRHVISVLRLKKVKFFCIIHDLDELRYGRPSGLNGGSEVELLNCYDAMVVHNDVMKDWLKEKGVSVPMFSLTVFDYLTALKITPKRLVATDLHSIVFAGNLSKSNFIYELGTLTGWKFNVYGPNYDAQKGAHFDSVTWKGSFSPTEILDKMDGAFGLIWDGDFVDQLDDKFGNYLKYNNPHKLSLYLAAGLPVIVPRQSAISSLIKSHEIGILIDTLHDLSNLRITAAHHEYYQNNVRKLAMRIQNGYYLQHAIDDVEHVLK